MFMQSKLLTINSIATPLVSQRPQVLLSRIGYGGDRIAAIAEGDKIVGRNSYRANPIVEEYVHKRCLSISG